MLYVVAGRATPLPEHRDQYASGRPPGGAAGEAGNAAPCLEPFLVSGRPDPEGHLST